MGILPVVETLEPHNTDTAQMLLDVNWRPALSVIGAGGLPPVESAGNVLRTHTDLALSLPSLLELTHKRP